MRPSAPQFRNVSVGIKHFLHAGQTLLVIHPATDVVDGSRAFAHSFAHGGAAAHVKYGSLFVHDLEDVARQLHDSILDVDLLFLLCTREGTNDLTHALLLGIRKLVLV